MVRNFQGQNYGVLVEKNEHFRHLVLYEFNLGSKATEAARNICAVYGEDSMAERTAQK
jgi:hypothetical protein